MKLKNAINMVRELTYEDKVRILDELKQEYKSAPVLSLDEMKSKALKLMQDFLEDNVDRDCFTHQFRIIDSNVKRILNADGDDIVMRQEWPLWLFGFCNHAFNVWSRLEACRMNEALSEEDIIKSRELLEGRIREALPN